MKTLTIAAIELTIIFFGLAACKQSPKEELFYTKPLCFADYSDPDIIRVVFDDMNL